MVVGATTEDERDLEVEGNGYGKSRRDTWLHAYTFINVTVFVVLIGLLEGGWNHLAKIIVFSVGAEQSYAYGPSALLQFPTVLPPQDIFFEATGVLTLLFGLLNVYYLWKLHYLPR